jgi:hypothetical protein
MQQKMYSFTHFPVPFAFAQTFAERVRDAAAGDGGGGAGGSVLHAAEEGQRRRATRRQGAKRRGEFATYQPIMTLITVVLIQYFLCVIMRHVVLCGGKG